MMLKYSTNALMNDGGGKYNVFLGRCMRFLQIQHIILKDE